MKLLSTSLSLFLCLLFVGALAAQNPTDRVKKRAEDRAERNVNNRIDRSVDKAVDDVIGSIFGKKKKKSTAENPEQPANSSEQNPNDAPNDAAMSEMLSNMLGGSEWEPYTNPRSMSFTNEIVTTKTNGKTEKVLMDLAITETKVGMYMHDEEEKGKTRMILDTQSGKTTIITTDKKGKTEGMRMRMPNMQAMVQDAMDEEVEDINNRIQINRTGERKTIDGYNCEKYIVTDQEEGTVTTAWVTNDLNLSMAELMGAMVGFVGGGQIKMPDMPKHGNMLDGIMIQANQVNQKGEKTDIYYRNIKLDGQTDQSILNVSGIPIQEVGF